ncbi:hypothetical protein [Anaerobacillus sp. 1_MG-2023]|uniref:hypothetical protein n=1 Tax=Bacillales TaxID=1385 RepID=UPI0026E3DD0C|nr:hypothetical protein [Anaerobacillus sp. 1_MG-2023]MDO6657184.1 hypothetical protein [Anaerobacillus sp. 1_MG-2023]
MNTLKMEIINSLKRKELHFVFIFMLIVAVSAFLIECLAFYGSDIRFVRSAAESTLMQGVYASSVRSTLFFVLPIICSLVYSDSFYVDYNNGVYKNIISRVSKGKYIFTKSLVVFSSTFLVFFFTLFINELLCLITFPQTGLDNIASLPPYDIGIQNYNESYVFDKLRLESPFLFNTLSVFIISIFAGLLSLVTYSIYFMFLTKNKIVGIMVTFIFYILINIGLAMLDFAKLTMFNQLNPSHVGTIAQLVAWIIGLLIIAAYFIYKKGIKKEWVIES